MKITATELNRHPGRYINHAIKEPVIVERSGQPVAVVVSYEHYVQLEDTFWGESATLADQDKSLKTKASMDFLQSDD
jgi:prevent-host-death family protein